MNFKILKLNTVFLLLLFMGASCQKDEFEYADESIEISTYPVISIYKTNADYFNNIMVGINDNNEVTSYPDYHEKSENVIANKNGEYQFRNKWLLKNGYIAVEGGNFNSAVTDISLTEYINFNEPYKTNWNSEILKTRIIETDPYSEFYYYDGLRKTPKTFTLGEINDMIENGTLETVFTKVK